MTEFLAIYWYMKMHSYSELSISSILSRTRMIWVLIFAFFLVHEQLRLLDYVGILTIFLGVSITSAPKRLFIDKGAQYANLSAVMIAINLILIKLLLPFGSDAVINVARGIPALIIFPFLMKNSVPRLKKVLLTKQKFRIPAVVLSGLSILCFTAALHVGDASKINAVYQGMMIFSVLAGIIFLKERGSIGRKIFGALVTIIGVVVLSLS
ncbi:EamA family transporter [Candidatus Microgenomates bacterium]|nr:EamA family transporter [Candidatus Microgenomates bacterium]